MTLVRYNPLNDFLPTTFGDLIESTLNNDRKPTSFRPQVDIFKTEKHYELHFVVPGMKKSDLVIDIDQNRLTVKGERKLEEDKANTLLKRESGYGKFERTFKLSEDINQSKIKANYEEGILKLELPLNKKVDNRRIININ